MFPISRKSLLVVAMVAFVWVLSACTGITDQLLPRFGVDMQRVDFLINSPSALDINIAAQSSFQSSCFEGGCHADLKVTQEQFVHPIFAQNECLICHTADHTDPEFTPERTLELCVSCHSPESLGNSHVVGLGVVDPRNGEMLTCLSCHGYHSGEYRCVLKMDGRGELCVSCHTKFLD
jgi:predicted CXXCH cytochrome family protein